MNTLGILSLVSFLLLQSGLPASAESITSHRRNKRLVDEESSLMTGQEATAKTEVWRTISNLGVDKAKDMLEDEKKSDAILRKAWAEAAANSAYDTDWKIAVIVYTQDDVYAAYNAACRELTASNYDSFGYKGYSFFLLQAFEENPLENRELPITLYRGTKNLKPDNMIPPLIEGQTYNFGQITSTSRSEVKASHPSFLNDQGTLLTIYFNISGPFVVDVDEYSDFNEEECIISPFSDMNVIKVTANQDSHDKVLLVEKQGKICAAQGGECEPSGTTTVVPRIVSITVIAALVLHSSSC